MVEEDQQTQVSHVFFPEWMNEWLCQWHERGFQQSKDFLSSDEEQWKSLVQLR